MNMNIMNKVGLAAMAVLTMASCSDTFLEEKKNYDNVNTGIYDYYEGASRRVSDVYSWCLPDPTSDANWKYNCTGNADDQSKSTEEYTGFSLFVHPDNEMMVVNGAAAVPDYFHNQSNNIQASVWGRIRNINDVIKGITNGSLSQDEKDELLGQVYFFRAWCYYQMVKWYGGVPIVDDVLEPIAENSTPRSSAKASVDFIINDLNTSAELLKKATANGGWSASNWGRVTSGTALALKGRVLLLWASPLFNRANDESRWKNAYDEMKRDLSVINSCGHSLYMGVGNEMNGQAFTKVFKKTRRSENDFVTLYNTIQSGDSQKNNPWERSIRPKNATGSGLNASAMIVDLFPMADGKIPASCEAYSSLPKSSVNYEADFPFMNRDPRFYRTFAFPGVRWAFDGDATMQNPENPSYNSGKDYELWNYAWYQTTEERDNIKNGGFGADNLGSNNKGIYVRKRSDDLDLNASPLYQNWAASANQSGFLYSAAPYVEIRYAEVLLNLAEAAAGAGQLEEAKSLLMQIRQRAGYTGDCGLDGITASQQTCMAAVLYERQIELAYEGKRFDDMRRWLLFDGGANFSEIEGAPASWKLTGWGGNTCTWLGFKPFNGQRRENMEFRVSNDWNDGLGYGTGTTVASDPITGDGEERCKAIDLRKDLAEQQETLKTWYQDHLVRKTRAGDSYDSNQAQMYMHFWAKYYFLGLSSGALNSDPNLQQTIGWQDTNRGNANGTFDPLAE